MFPVKLSLLIFFVYEHFTPAFWLHNNLWEFTALEHKFRMWFYYQKPVLNVVRFKRFLVYKNKSDAVLVRQIQLIKQ